MPTSYFFKNCHVAAPHTNLNPHPCFLDYHLRLFHFLGKSQFFLCIRPEKVLRHHSWVHLPFFVCLSIATIHSRNHEMFLSKDYYTAKVGLPPPYGRLSFQCFVLFISQVIFFIFLFRDPRICDLVYLKVNLTSAQYRKF